MKYCKYFRGVLNNDGLPQLNAREWARMINIASIEYGISRLIKVKEMNENGPEPFKYDLMIAKEQDILNDLTENLEPRKLIRKMLDDSLSW